MGSLAVVILAGGRGTRMKSKLAKVLHPLAGKPILSYSLDLTRRLQPDRIVLVVGAQRDEVRRLFHAPDIIFADQEEQLGTGHAVTIASRALQDFSGTVLILCADVPLLTEKTVQRFGQVHRESGATLSVLTTILEDPRGYGRIIRKGGNILRILEDRDLPAGLEGIREINTGIYCVDSAFLLSALPSLNNRNAQGEFYLTDIVEMAASGGMVTTPVVAGDPFEVMGINTRLDLARAGQILRQRIAEKHMLAGVTLLDPQTTYIDDGVEIGKDTVIHANAHLLGKTVLGEDCVVEPGCTVSDYRIGNSVHIKAYSVMAESVVEAHVDIGPFARLRPQTVLKEGSRVGNFVEVKKSVIGKGTKASHLSYIGDATLGEKVNVGAGTITCNYDGRRKNQTIVEDGVFIGSNTSLVAPVTIGKNALIGAGSTITKGVPPETLAVTRADQVHYKKRSRPKE